jgi:hypothetical protein
MYALLYPRYIKKNYLLMDLRVMRRKIKYFSCDSVQMRKEISISFNNFPRHKKMRHSSSCVHGDTSLYDETHNTRNKLYQRKLE